MRLIGNFDAVSPQKIIPFDALDFGRRLEYLRQKLIFISDKRKEDKFSFVGVLGRTFTSQ